MSLIADLKSFDPSQRSAIWASYLGWTLDAFDYFLMAFMFPGSCIPEFRKLIRLVRQGGLDIHPMLALDRQPCRLRRARRRRRACHARRQNKDVDCGRCGANLIAIPPIDRSRTMPPANFRLSGSASRSACAVWLRGSLACAAIVDIAP
jgi:hypothetical protein